MRDIKFRLYHDKQGMVYPDNKFHLIAPPYILKLDPQIKESRYFIMPLSDFDIMQYTGLNDKNGVEIYEGDIIKEITRYPKGGLTLKFEVMFNDCAFTLGNQYLLHYHAKEDIEIIGNIHENPDLV